MRLIALKHLRNWSYQALEREVRANVVYREFTRIRGEKVADSKTMVRWGKALGPQVTRAIHERVVDLGHKRGVVRAQTSGGYHGGRDRHSLSDRQWVIGGRGAGHHAHDEADPARGRRCRDSAAGSKPQCQAPTDRDWALGDA